MNKLTKLMLASAVLATSGFATESDNSLINGELIVNGNFVQNEAVEIAGKVTVGDGGALENKSTMTFGAESGLQIVKAFTKDDFAKWNDDYKLGVWGEKYITVKFAEGSRYSGTSSTDDWDVAKAWTTSEEVDGDDLAIGFVEYLRCYKNCLVSIEKNDTNVVTYVSGTVDTSAWYEADDVKRFIDMNAAGVAFRFTAYYAPGEGTKVYKPAEFVANVKAAAAAKKVEGDFTKEIQAMIVNASTTGGSFDNKTGTVDLTAATDAGTFEGTIAGGAVNLSDQTTGDFSNLVLNTVNVAYSYNGANVYSEPTVNEESYIKVTGTVGKDETTAKSECGSRFSSESQSLTITATNREVAESDSRLTFAEMLADTTNLNKSGVKMKTDEVATIVKDYASASKLNANAAIVMQLEGDDALTFATGITETSGQVIEFAGDQSDYTGVASFDGINVVRASATNALPVKLMENMGSIALEISGGENKVNNNGGTVKVKNLKINSDAKFIIGAGTTFESGVSGK